MRCFSFFFFLKKYTYTHPILRFHIGHLFFFFFFSFPILEHPLDIYYVIKLEKCKIATHFVFVRTGLQCKLGIWLLRRDMTKRMHAVECDFFFLIPVYTHSKRFIWFPSMLPWIPPVTDSSLQWIAVSAWISFFILANKKSYLGDQDPATADIGSTADTFAANRYYQHGLHADGFWPSHSHSPGK